MACPPRGREIERPLPDAQFPRPRDFGLSGVRAFGKAVHADRHPLRCHHPRNIVSVRIETSRHDAVIFVTCAFLTGDRFVFQYGDQSGPRRDATGPIRAATVFADLPIFRRVDAVQPMVYACDGQCIAVAHDNCLAGGGAHFAADVDHEPGCNQPAQQQRDEYFAQQSHAVRPLYRRKLNRQDPWAI